MRAVHAGAQCPECHRPWPGSEPCVFVGPAGRWFDFACAAKTAGTTPGPEITWGGARRMYDLEALCMVPRPVFDAAAAKSNVTELAVGVQ